MVSIFYTGKAIKPVIKVKDGENTLVEGKDYKVSYSDNVNAGTATVKVEGIGAYAGTVEKNLQSCRLYHTRPRFRTMAGKGHMQRMEISVNSWKEQEIRDHSDQSG